MRNSLKVALHEIFLLATWRKKSIYLWGEGFFGTLTFELMSCFIRIYMVWKKSGLLWLQWLGTARRRSKCIQIIQITPLRVESKTTARRPHIFFHGCKGVATSKKLAKTQKNLGYSFTIDPHKKNDLPEISEKRWNFREKY